MKKLFTVALMAMLAIGTYAKDVKTKLDTLVVTPTPTLKCVNCEKKVKGNLRFVKGTKNITANHLTQRITIVYDPSKAKPADYMAALKKMGYTAKVTK